MLFEKLIYTHLGFTGIAIISGIIAMVASPKGSQLHKKGGLIYLYSFIGIIATAVLMVLIKYKDLFLGITIFNTYLLFMGYRILKRKHSPANWLDWSMLAIFFCGGWLMLIGAMRIDDDFFTHGYKWSAVRAFFAILTFYITVKDFRYLRNKLHDKKSWLYNHIEKMLLSYVSLIVGVGLRVFDYLPYKESKWAFWIIPYLICIPLIVLWIGKYKSNKLKTSVAVKD